VLDHLEHGDGPKAARPKIGVEKRLIYDLEVKAPIGLQVLEESDARRRHLQTNRLPSSGFANYQEVAKSAADIEQPPRANPPLELAQDVMIAFFREWIELHLSTGVVALVVFHRLAWCPRQTAKHKPAALAAIERDGVAEVEAVGP
jgi:hypothetical protein